MSRRRRRSYEKKKPVAAATIWSSLLGLICFLVALTLMFLSASGIDFGKIPGVVGVMAMLFAIIAFSVGVRTAKETDYDVVTRALGVIVPGVAMAALLLLYFAGILFG